MKLQLSDVLFILLVLTFTLGTYIVLQDPRTTFYFALYYATSLYILRRSLTEDFYVSAEKNRFEVSESKTIVLGETLPSKDRVDLQEERYLSHFNLNTLAKRQFFTYFILALAVFLLFYKAKVPVGLTSVVPIICGLMFIKSVFVGHLLLPIGLNIYLVISQNDKEGTISPVHYILYVFILFSCLKIMSDLSGPQLKWKKSFALLPAVILFSASVYGFNFFFEEKPKSQELIKELAPTRRALRDVRSETNSLLSKLTNLPETSASLGLRQKLSQQLEDISKYEGMIAQNGASPENRKMLENILNNHKENAQGMKELRDGLLERKEGSFSPSLEALSARHDSSQSERLENLKDAIEKNQQELFEKQKDSSAQDEEVKSLEKNRKTLKEEFEKMSSLSPSEREELQNFVNKKAQEIKSLKALGQKSAELPDLEQKLKEVEATAKNPAPSMDDLRQLSKNLEATKRIDDMKSQAMNSSFEESSPIEASEALKPFEKKNFPWKKFIPLTVLILLILIVSHFLKKKGIKEIEILDPELLEEFKTKWKALKKLKLSPREEVIHYYNILHEIFQKVHYPTHETPPSCIVFEHMKDFNPKLDQATYLVTETYTQCFYGDKEVTQSALKNFRKAVTKIMHVYGI